MERGSRQRQQWPQLSTIKGKQAPCSYLVAPHNPGCWRVALDSFRVVGAVLEQIFRYFIIESLDSFADLAAEFVFSCS